MSTRLAKAFLLQIIHTQFATLQHVQHIPIVDDSELTPENRFLRTAADASRGESTKSSTDRKFAAYILSSFEVDIQGSLIGSGAMGQVFTGEWRGSVSVVKFLRRVSVLVILCRLLQSNECTPKMHG